MESNNLDVMSVKESIDKKVANHIYICLKKQLMKSIMKN